MPDELLARAHVFFREIYGDPYEDLEPGEENEPWYIDELRRAEAHYRFIMELHLDTTYVQHVPKERIMRGPAAVSLDIRVQQKMGASYVYLMLNEREESEKLYREVLFYSIPTDVDFGYIFAHREFTYLTSEMLFRYISHYDVLLCKMDGRTPCLETLTKYKSLLPNLEAGTLSTLDYPIRAELRKSEFWLGMLHTFKRY